MRDGKITGITTLRDRLRFTLENDEREAAVEVYKTAEALGAHLGAYVWTQGGCAYLTTDNDQDVKLWLIRQDDGQPEPWPLAKVIGPIP